MKKKKMIAGLLLFGVVFSACKKDTVEKAELAKPGIKNIEVGLNNNERGFIGHDFHFDATILAASKIENVQIKIQQKSGETYAKVWSHEITWTQYNGVKNTNVHKHFNIPKDAIEGKYDFIITVTDQNGAKLEVRKGIHILDAANFPMNPKIKFFTIWADTADLKERMHIDYERFRKTALIYSDYTQWKSTIVLKKDNYININVQIDSLKGSGKMYILIINKKLNHRPETIDQIDFTKAIVYNVTEHQSGDIFSMIRNSGNGAYSGLALSLRPGPSGVRSSPLFIGAANDNSIPSSPITGDKAWESGNYYFALIYHNTTYNIGLFKYVEFRVNIN